MTQEIPVRVPPPLVIAEGTRKPFFECGQRVRLRGKLVECIRRKNHPVAINYGHSNGYDEWCFESTEENS